MQSNPGSPPADRQRLQVELGGGASAAWLSTKDGLESTAVFGTSHSASRLLTLSSQPAVSLSLPRPLPPHPALFQRGTTPKVGQPDFLWGPELTTAAGRSRFPYSTQQPPALFKNLISFTEVNV